MKRVKNFEELLQKFDAFLQKNNLPTEKIWLRARHTRLEDPTGESREGNLYLYFPKSSNSAAEKDAYYDEGLSLENIKHIYARSMGISGEYVFGFIVITIIDGKTVCGVLGDWFGFPDERPELEFYNNNLFVLACDDYFDWWKNDCTLIDDVSEWKEIVKKPRRLSNLDYLFDW